jgi:gliding motility-associated-like protein
MTAKDTIACKPFLLIAKSYDSADATIISRKWILTTCGGTFVASSNSNSISFPYIFPNPGCYCLSLLSKRANGDSCYFQQCNIVVADTPNINMIFAPTEACAPVIIHDTCNVTTSTGTISNIIIQPGCGPAVQIPSCPANPISLPFNNCAPGYYDVTVVAVNNVGCSSTKHYNNVIHIIPIPVASFTADTTSANCASGPLTVNFTAQNAGAHMTYDWYINGVHTPADTGLNWQHTFAINPICYDIKLVVTHISGCSNSVTINQYICVRSFPSVSFTKSDSIICVGQGVSVPVTLTNTTPGLNSLTWHVSGGTPFTNYAVSTGGNYTVTISNPGTYTVTATGSFGSGCSTTVIQQFLIAKPKPPASFTQSDSFSCKTPICVQFTGNGCPTCSYTWQFISGTPTTANTINASTCYFSTGMFSARFVVTDTNGCNTTVFKQNATNVTRIFPKIKLTSTKGCAPLCTNLSNITNAIPNNPFASACWSFPGTNLIPGACTDTISRCFTVPGCYSVRLTVSTTTGCIDSTTLTDTICARNPPVCNATANPTDMCYESDTVHFCVNCDSISTVFADFGDGNHRTYTSANHTSICFDYFYQDIGHFDAKLVTFRDSCIGDTFHFNIVIHAPAAKFKDSTSCALGDTVFLVNQTRLATSYMWYFCNGDSSSSFNQKLILSGCDTCRVRLVAYNDTTFCTHTYDTIVKGLCLNPGFVPIDTFICAGKQIKFVNTSSSNSFTRWDFDVSNGLNLTNTAPSGNTIFHTFPTSGTYTVAMLNISLPNIALGCKDTVYGTVHVCKPVANFGYIPVCYPQPLQFIDSTLDTVCGITKWQWTFGNNLAQDSVQNAQYVFPGSGTYPVKLVVRNNTGCTDSITKTVNVSTPVVLNYSLDTLICFGAQSCVTNNSTGVALVYQWNAPGANTPSSASPTPCFSYPSQGDYTIYLQVSSGGVCSIFDTLPLHVHNPIAVGYVDIDTLLCPNPPTLIHFTDTSLYNDGTRVWYFGDTTVGFLPNTTHIYTQPGDYVISLVVTSQDGCRDSAVIDTIVVFGPDGNFSYMPSPGICACQDTVHFTINTIKASALTFVWGCAQGVTQINPIIPVGTEINPTTVYVDVPYCVTDTCLPQIIFGDLAGCQVYKDLPYIWVDSPTVKFTFDNYGVCVNGTVCFHDSTIYHIASNESFTIKRVWDFGDGSALDTSNNPNPCHYYSGPGGYNAKLYVWSNLGCYDSLISQIVVIPKYPQAGYYADDSLVCANNPICFHDTSTIYPLTGPAYWIWEFGDSVGVVDTFYTPNVCHIFPVGGYYRVHMCVYDSIGCPDCDSSTVIRVIDNPIANAGGDQATCFGYPTQLTGSGGGSYYWSPPAIFSNPTIYNPTVLVSNDTSVSLVVTNMYGCSDTDTAILHIARVFAAFTVSGNTFCRGDSVCVTDVSTNSNGTLINWVYNFGDGDSVSGANICYEYPVSGTFNIILRAYDNHGCFDTATNTVTILPSPVAKFSTNDTVICSTQFICPVDLTTSPTPVASWSWNYGDNFTYTGQNPPCHKYSVPLQSPYTMSLIVTDQNSCADTAKLTVIVHATPRADFSWSISCEDGYMPLSSTSLQGDIAIDTCEWLFWVGAPSPVTDYNCNTTFHFPPGLHDVQLIVRDLNDCADTIVKTVVTDSLSKLVIYPGDTIICLGTSVDYHVSGIFSNITWSPNIWISDPYSPTVTITPQGNIGYIVSAVNGVCNSDNDTFTVRVIQPIPIEVNATPQQIVLGLTSNITSQIAGQIDSISWSPCETLDCCNCPNPIARPTETTTYTATIYFSQLGVTCTNSASVTIVVINVCDEGIVYVPNTFTPNGDGLNDVFMIRGLAATKINYFRIFDRWGKLIYEAANGVPNDPRFGWDGTDSKGEKLNPAVYVYAYEIECINHEIVTGKGNVTLVR